MPSLQEFSYQASLMGTDLDVVFISATAEESLFQEILLYGQMLEGVFSRFQPESELSLLNKQQSLVLSPLFIEVWTIVQSLYKQTNGAFNPLLSPVHLGYEKDFRSQHKNFTLKPHDFNTDFERISFDSTGSRLRLHSGQIIDFGGFLKGFAAQKMSEIASRVPGGIINLGGDVRVWGQDLTSKKFELVIENPIHEALSPTVYLQNESLSTSGTYKRHWLGKHHILDAHTKNSSESDLISASIIGTDGAQTDAFATVAIALGSFKAGRWLDALGMRYVFIDKKGEITQKI